MAPPTPEEHHAVLVAIRDSEVRFVTDGEGPPIYDVPAEINPALVNRAVELGLAALEEPTRVGLSVVQDVRLTAVGEQRLSDETWPER
ncbi:hypothetical protein [Conexibacter sp. CPCC 206217]|uniref:hypothetical protein n=1 Tax=Conexibacter sp. CPCC 206217 TaxID=3064574 RepID=UPI00272334EB|nr:hypothetical protein [Conexibacter sp. CPCC 206217]MDO8212927.1 hypothetical protein [Conexibacter sp. CPCC 206217]